MGLNAVPSSERIHIGFFGRRNAGKSSVINAVTGQKLSIVSDTLGTTTDPVVKSMELLPLGAVTVIDTPGIDDIGELGEMRVEKTYQVLNKCDIAIVVIDSEKGRGEDDEKLIKLIEAKKIPYIICYNKSDISKPVTLKKGEISVSAETGKGITELKEMIASLKNQTPEKKILLGKIRKGDVVILVMPIDEAAPKGRIILPQQQTLREILDCGGICMCVQPDELEQAINNLSVKPRLVVTDSQVFGRVSQIVPDDILLTSFSVLFLNYKGELDIAYSSVSRIDELKDGDVVLISEGCTHHRQCNDIGTVKLPNAIRKRTGADLKFEFTSGGEFPTDLSPYKLVVHCGGCMLNEREVKNRMNYGAEKGIPVTNYGIALAYMNGILERTMKFFDE